MVAELSSVEFRHAHILANAAALFAHLSVGVCWAVFYAFFFWGRFRWRPPVQGLVFAAIPATLAVLIVYPELALMRVPAHALTFSFDRFFAPLRPATVGSLLVSHALFGLTIGSIYRRPVGYAVGHKPPPPRLRPRHEARRRKESATGFIFATGIECSYPTIERGKWRRDEMDSTRHYEVWQEDFRLARAIGITHIRYGPPLHLIFEGPGRYDWDYIDPQMEELRDLGPEP
ncbi:MAG: hypothetical protein ACM3SX_09470, partial [Deltaproteobacteria bacterium]